MSDFVLKVYLRDRAVGECNPGRRGIHLPGMDTWGVDNDDPLLELVGRAIIKAIGAPVRDLLSLVSPGPEVLVPLVK